VLGIVGRFAPGKRHDLLLAAFEELSHEWPTAQLLIVGAGGSEYDRVVRLARESPCADRIHLAGFQENPRPWYQAMDVFILPSLVEGMSNAVLEAMACGVPVLSHRSCAASEIFLAGDSGFVADLESSADLAEHLRSILSNPERLTTVGRNARTAVMSRFSLNEMVRQYELLYLGATRPAGNHER
jgi:glycosyltransferase involved in cell wall biosynthesis